MVIAGFMPDLVGCRNCGTDRDFPLWLDLNGGDMLCNKCKSASAVQGSFVELDKTTFAAMRHIVYSEFSKLYSFTLPSQNAKYLSFVTERYLLAQTERRFKTLDFFHSLEVRL
jgi:DNA repair protein RecO (recombination protein O)